MNVSHMPATTSASSVRRPVRAAAIRQRDDVFRSNFACKRGMIWRFFLKPHHRVTPSPLFWIEHGWTYLYRTEDFRACTAALEMKMKNEHRFNACANLPTPQRFVFAPSQGKIQADRVYLCVCVPVFIVYAARTLML